MTSRRAGRLARVLRNVATSGEASNSLRLPGCPPRTGPVTDRDQGLGRFAGDACYLIQWWAVRP